LKEGGYLLIADFCYLEMPCDNFFFGMYTECYIPNHKPKEFELFNFIIDKAPTYKFEIFHIPRHTMI